MERFDAVVIGAGNGGMGAATALACNGVKPLVIERHNLPGGVASSFVRGRFEFETALHVLYYDGDKETKWGQFGVTEEFVPIEQTMTYAFTDKSGTIQRYDVPMSLEGLTRIIEQTVPGSAEKLQSLFGVCGEMLMGLMAISAPDADPEEINKQYPHFFPFSKMTCQEAYDALEIPEDIQGLINFLWFYEGPSIRTMTFSLYAMVLFGVLNARTHFPRHCSNGFNADFETIIRKHGGDVWYNTTVEAVLVENGRVRGVRTNRGDVIETNTVISNAAPVSVYKMVEPQSEVRPNSVQIQNSLVENMSFFVVYLGLDASAEELGITNHHIFINESVAPHATFDASLTREGPWCMGTLCYNKTIPDFSPEGTCVVSISVPMHGSAWEGLSQKEYMVEKYRVAEEIVKSAGEHLNVDLLGHIEEISVATPVTFARYGGMRNGALGYEDSMTHSALVRQVCNAQENYIEGLSFVGQFANGIGYENNTSGIATGEAVAAALNAKKGGK